jgi:RNA polymerase sigma factor (sigma-70 family)
MLPNPRRPTAFQRLETAAGPEVRPLDAAARARVAESLPLAYYQAGKAARGRGRRVPLDELTAEALYALTYAASRFDPARAIPFAAYASIVIRHRLIQVAIAWHRHRAIHRFPDSAGDGSWEPADPAAAQPPDASAVAEFCRRARDLLPPRWYNVVRLYVQEGWTMEAIGAEFGFTRQRVYEIVRRSAARVRRRFREWEVN